MIGWEAVEIMRKDPEAMFKWRGIDYRVRENKLYGCYPYGAGGWHWVETQLQCSALACDDWGRVTKPLTDEELVEKLETARARVSEISAPYYQSATYNDALGAVVQCIRGLRERIAAKGGE